MRLVALAVATLMGGVGPALADQQCMVAHRAGRPVPRSDFLTRPAAAPPRAAPGIRSERSAFATVTGYGDVREGAKMLRAMLFGACLGALVTTPASANIYNTVSCFRGSTYDGDPHNVAGKGTCNKGHYIKNKHNPYRFIHGPGVVVRH